jgi:hypothetical protein
LKWFGFEDVCAPALDLIPFQQLDELLIAENFPAKLGRVIMMIAVQVDKQRSKISFGLI